MTTRKKTKKPQRLVRSEEYKKEAVKLAETVGVTNAAKQLGIHTTQLYNWRNKLRVKESRSEAENRLMEENARLTRELAEKKQENDFLKKASTYFAKHQK
jgi:transposase